MRGVVVEVIAINIVWPCALGVLAVGFLIQNSGLALFLATYFYTLTRLYQLSFPNNNE